MVGRMSRLARTMERRFAPRRQALDRALARLERDARVALDGRRRRLGTLAARLEALSPLATLQRGYSVARSSDGQVLRALDDLPAGTTFELRVTDGRVAAESLGPVPDPES